MPQDTPKRAQLDLHAAYAAKHGKGLSPQAVHSALRDGHLGLVSESRLDQ